MRTVELIKNALPTSVTSVWPIFEPQPKEAFGAEQATPPARSPLSKMSNHPAANPAPLSLLLVALKVPDMVMVVVEPDVTLLKVSVSAI